MGFGGENGARRSDLRPAPMFFDKRVSTRIHIRVRLLLLTQDDGGRGAPPSDEVCLSRLFIKSEHRFNAFRPTWRGAAPCKFDRCAPSLDARGGKGFESMRLILKSSIRNFAPRFTCERMGQQQPNSGQPANRRHRSGVRARLRETLTT